MKTNPRKNTLEQIIKEKPQAVLVKNKYKVLAGLLRRTYPANYKKIREDLWEDIIYLVVNGDRDLRLLTEGMDKENKVRLEQEYILGNIMS